MYYNVNMDDHDIALLAKTDNSQQELCLKN